MRDPVLILIKSLASARISIPQADSSRSATPPSGKNRVAKIFDINPGYTAYCASKSVIDRITKALGCEWSGNGITVNAIAPTVFRSPLTAWIFEDTERAKEVRRGFLGRVPKARLGEPDPLLFLASKASDFYTGHILCADGGYGAG